MKGLFPASTWQPRRGSGFTLVEVMVSITILSLILLLTFSMIGSAGRLWSGASASVERFREARVAFEAMTRRLSQAVLNTYWDYDNADGPTKYIRQSELHFISGPRDTLLDNGASPAPALPGGTAPGAAGYTHAVFFQAPLGYVSANSYTGANTLLNRAELNACGYFVDYSDDSLLRPAYLRGNSAVPARSRFRLFEYRQPAERFAVYLDNYPNQQYKGTVTVGSPPPTLQYQTMGSVTAKLARKWYSDDLSSYSRVIADNVIALIISPRTPGLTANGAAVPDFAEAPAYLYDTRGQLCGLQAGINLTGTKTSLSAATANVLPPVLDITMVALDEASAARYAAGQNGTKPPVAAAANGSGSPGNSALFRQLSSHGPAVSAGDTDDQYESDLATLEGYLTSQHLTYEIFRTSVAIRAAKFSKE